ncbi:hypothetical protein BJP34_23070 [Moorena producens PAL-8-15-08-1]|uniref:Uncharacterized protein n=1 Tax=Moorena producens PAL-8-15-08-1 TaxID=1458985 RepID=A0A1D8TWU0_9CYAN|nr:hypothetical protein BJP34_23070 [Moorena producens PAL-8-15-08-1]
MLGWKQSHPRRGMVFINLSRRIEGHGMGQKANDQQKRSVLKEQDLRKCPLNPPSEGLLARGTLTSLPRRIGGQGGKTN